VGSFAENIFLKTSTTEASAIRQESMPQMELQIKASGECLSHLGEFNIFICPISLCM
jgi:hypothetical protein